jgi:phosphoribosylformylglycinamidine (FGAM) synthase PurS component
MPSSSARVISIRLKIPDNEAYTALTALRRLGVAVDRLERAEIVWLAPGAEPTFNPNKHVVTDLASDEPREGETWVEETGFPGRAVAWRLYDADGLPAARPVVEFAAERLLCNPAIEKARFHT